MIYFSLIIWSYLSAHFVIIVSIIYSKYILCVCIIYKCIHSFYNNYEYHTKINILVKNQHFLLDSQDKKA